MRTTSRENHDLALMAELFPATKGCLDVLEMLAPLRKPVSSRRISNVLGIRAAAATEQLRDRGIVIYEASKIRLNDGLPFMRHLRALVRGYTETRRPRISAEPKLGDEAIRRAATLLFRAPTTAYVLVALSAGPMTGADLQRIGSVLCKEAMRLSRAGIIIRTVQHGVTRYELNQNFERAAQLRRLLLALKCYMPVERIPKHDPQDRTNYGVRHYRARLSDDVVRQIVTRRRHGESAAALAKEFKITDVYVRALCRSEYRKSAWVEGHDESKQGSGYPVRALQSKATSAARMPSYCVTPALPT